MKVIQFLILSVAIMAAVSGTTWACTAAGPTTHVGKVLKVDTEKKTFTILDAQIVAPITFQADEDIMKKVVDAKGTAFVDFKAEGINLIATDVVIR